MKAQPPLTLLERAKVAAATGSNMVMNGQAMVDLLVALDGARADLERNANDIEAILAQAARVQRRSIVILGIGLGAFIAGVIL